jgi:hypothetical protein
MKGRSCLPTPSCNRVLDIYGYRTASRRPVGIGQGAGEPHPKLDYTGLRQREAGTWASDVVVGTRS